ncbi:Serine/threonine-protein kinase [Pelomyxa schiedti]|nr:Serine/threonine-protein kinase [Pelomyxa schiedti]
MASAHPHHAAAILAVTLALLAPIIAAQGPSCTGGGLWVTASLPWADDGSYVDVPVVLCSSTQPEFIGDMSGASDHMPHVDYFDPELAVTWGWSPPDDVVTDWGTTGGLDQCFFTNSWAIRLSGESEGSAVFPEYTYTYAILDDGWVDYGAAPTSADDSATFLVDIYCWDYAEFSVSFSFEFSCGRFVNSTVDGEPAYFENFYYERNSFELRWLCYWPGCTDWCDEHGTCLWVYGVCECDPLWAGPDCVMQYSMEDTLCPSDPVIAQYYVPPLIYGEYDLAGLQVYDVNAVTNSEIQDWRYLLTWTTWYNPNDPNIELGVAGTGQFPSFLSPSVWAFIVRDSGGWVLLEYDVVVLDYTECGYTQDEVDCETGQNDCNAETDNGACYDNKCWCNGGYYWFDCSRGCPSFTKIHESTGLIPGDAYYNKSDPMRGAAYMHYLNKVECRWFVDVGKKYDKILFEFEFIAFWGDTVAIYYSDSKGNQGDLVRMYSWSPSAADLAPITIESTKILVVMSSDNQMTDIGFAMNFTAQKEPLPSFAIGIIVVVLGIVGVVGLGAAGAGLVFFAKRQRRLAQAARNAPAEKMPAMTKEEIAAVLAKTSERDEHLTEVGLGLDKPTLTFGLAESDACPVMQQLDDELVVMNRSKRRMHYCFYVANTPHLMELSITPGTGFIPSRSAVRVKVKFILKYTTHYEHPVKLEMKPANAKEGEEEIETLWVMVKLEGAVSERIDPEEVMLDPLPIASGGFGSVFGGVYRTQMVAVKILKHQEAFREAEMNDFNEECELMKRLRHPYIVTFIGASHIPGKLCICTELIERGSLGSYLDSDVDIPYVLILKFALNAAEAMAFLHKNNILFRDFKAGNLLLVSTALDAPVNCKLTDFGTARNVENPGQINNYTCGLGTPVYMAPELLTTKPYNSKVDVFSFGICLWEMWMRDEPWADVPCWDIPRKVAGGARPEFDEECPQNYSSLAIKCWAQEIESRPEFETIATTVGSMLEEISPEVAAIKADATNATAGDPAAIGKVNVKQLSRRRTRTRTRTGDGKSHSGMISMSDDPEKAMQTADASKFNVVNQKDKDRLARGSVGITMTSATATTTTTSNNN